MPRWTLVPTGHDGRMPLTVQPGQSLKLGRGSTIPDDEPFRCVHRSHAEVLVPPGGGDRLKVTPLGGTAIGMYRTDPTHGGRLTPASTTAGAAFLWLQHGDTLHLLLPRDGRRPIAYTVQREDRVEQTPADARFAGSAAPIAAEADPAKRACSDAHGGGKKARLPGRCGTPLAARENGAPTQPAARQPSALDGAPRTVASTRQAPAPSAGLAARSATRPPMPTLAPGVSADARPPTLPPRATAPVAPIAPRPSRGASPPHASLSPRIPPAPPPQPVRRPQPAASVQPIGGAAAVGCATSAAPGAARTLRQLTDALVHLLRARHLTEASAHFAMELVTKEADAAAPHPPPLAQHAVRRIAEITARNRRDHREKSPRSYV